MTQEFKTHGKDQKRSSLLISGAMETKQWNGREVCEKISFIHASDYREVCLLPEYDNDEEVAESKFCNINIPGSGLLSPKVSKEQCIVAGDDRFTVELFLEVPIAPGTEMFVDLTTWVNPGGTTSLCENDRLNAGIIVEGERSDEKDKFLTLKNGVECYGFVDVKRCKFTTILNVMEEGQKRETLEGRMAELSLSNVQIKITRDISGDATFDFTQAENKHVVKRKEDDESRGKDLQLYISSYGRPDNVACIRFNNVTLKQAASSSNDAVEASKGEAGKKRSREVLETAKAKSDIDLNDAGKPIEDALEKKFR